MATSSIFHNIVIDDEAGARAFIAALEASEAHPRKRPGGPARGVTADPARLRRVLELNRQARETAR